MLIYISGKYSDTDQAAIDANLRVARDASVAAWEKGLHVFTPHLNTARFEIDCRATYAQYIEADLDILTRCDAICMLPNWETSTGARTELAHAERLGLPVYYYPDMPPAQHPTEVRCPTQAKGFLEIVMRMYRVHLDKNADYSPANILATGEIGLVTRLWDKIARLMNLLGFRFAVECQGYEAPRTPRHESIDDTLMDAAVYAIIGLLLRKGMWGK